MASSRLPRQHRSLSYPHFGKYDTLIKYTLVPSIPLSIIAILCVNPNTWVLSELHHFYIELFAVILAAILSFYYIARAYTLDDKFSLFIGIGFLANALIDLLHVVVSYTYMDEFMFLKYFIPQTWFAGRIFLGAMFVIAIAGYPQLSRTSSSTNNKTIVTSSALQEEQAKVGQGSAYLSSTTPSVQSEKEELPIVDKRRERQKMPKIIVGYLVALTIISAYIAISSLFIVFPGSVIDDFPIHRPYEIPGLALFLVALLYFYKNQLYRKSDIFYKGLLGALVIDIFGQIIMSYSTTSFDTAHNTAHILKDAAYFVNIIGLALSSIQYNAKLKEANRNLIEREEVIRSQYERLKESDKMQKEFINIASHEMKTPTQAILGFSNLLETHPEKKMEINQGIKRNAARLQRLTNDILDVTRIESHTLKLNKETFNLNDLISHIIEDYRNQIDNVHIQLMHNSDKTSDYNENNNLVVEADKSRMTQVISNLLSNSIKFTNSEGSISVRSEKKDSHIIVSVKDTGTGIDPEIMPKLFTKFATKSQTSGTGLGLFISKSIIEAHGGKIWGENYIHDTKKGSIFAFSLPLNNHSRGSKIP
ncbi:MAG: ATP-binding protein [Nitrososphaeraceae archaeon]|nr:ATP-binding protein [Nitrososphaeraceae archaeon]MDW0332125.1 ATP-binding protein [Nitrososphaeraceae archaeon]